MLCQLTFYYSFSLIIYFCSLLNIETTLYLDEFLNVAQLAAYLLCDPPLIVNIPHPPVKARVVADLRPLIKMMTHHAEHILQFLTHIIEVLRYAIQNKGSRSIHRLVIDLFTEGNFGYQVVYLMVEVDYMDMD